MSHSLTKHMLATART